MEERSNRFKLKRDRYMSVRGGTSSFFNIYCAHCRRWLLLYQKDGPGNLYRLYVDRIHAPEDEDIKKSSRLICTNCNIPVGVLMTYKREDRLAFRLIPGSIVKKKSNGDLPAPPTAEPKEGIDEGSES